MIVRITTYQKERRCEARKARDFSRRAVDSAVRADSKETAALWQANAALREAEWGDTASANQGVTAALALSPGRDVKVAAALALARIGDAPRATALVGELEKSYATNAMLKLYWLPTINAAIELSEGAFWYPIAPGLGERE